MKKRLLIIAGIFVFVFAVVINKIGNERNVQGLDQTLSEMYVDRLLVESYIYQLTELFYKKKIDLLKDEGLDQASPEMARAQKQTTEIVGLIDKYAHTRLTENERQIFGRLKENIQHMRIAESNLFSKGDSGRRELERIYDLSVKHLHQLSAIQVSEGSLLKENGRKVLSSAYLSVQLEWAVVVIISLLLFSVLRRRKLVEEILPKHQLN